MHPKQSKYSTKRAFLLGIAIPFLSLLAWYMDTQLLYKTQQYISNHYQSYARYAYIALSGLLYGSLALAILFPLWAWWRLLGRKRLAWWRWKPLLLALVFTSSVTYYFAKQASIEVETAPDIISHRAIDNNNAVENTLEALQLTSKKHPDYIEIDVYETADKDFVVFHNHTLKNAGSKKHPHDLTLSEITKLTVNDGEFGHTGHIPSFETMLTEAEKRHQKLLIDFKTSKADSPEMVETFLRRYQKRIEKHHHQVQSFDATFMQKILAHKPKFETFLIASTVPETELKGLTGYSIQLSTLRDDLFMDIVHKNQKIYVWTVNDEESVSQAEYLAVDGIITDVMTETKQELETIKIYRDYVALFYERLYYLHLVS